MAQWACLLTLAASLPHLVQGRFNEALTVEAEPRVRLAGVDLPHDAYYGTVIPAKPDNPVGAERNLVKYRFSDKKSAWEVKYKASETEYVRPAEMNFDENGDVYMTSLSKEDDNTIYFRKFDKDTGKLLFTKELTPCVGYDRDYTEVDVSRVEGDIFAIGVACEFREYKDREAQIAVYGLDSNGEQLWVNTDIPGRLVVRVRSSPDLKNFVVNTMRLSSVGTYEGIFAMTLDAKTGKYISDLKVVSLEPDPLAQNAEEVALANVMAVGIGADSTALLSESTKESAAFLDDLNAARGETALFVIGRKPLEDGPTYLEAFDKKTGEFVESIVAGPNLPAAISALGDTVAVLMYGNDAADVLAVFEYTRTEE